MVKEPIPEQTLEAVRYLAEEGFNNPPSIGHTLFREKYLPLLATPPERDSNGVIIPRDIFKWVDDVAKLPTNEVHVVDDKTGKVKYIVPPLVGRFSTVYPGAGEGISGIVKEAIERSANHPRLGANYLSNALGCSMQSIPKHHSESVELWNRVLVDHGYDPIPGYAAAAPLLPPTETTSVPETATATLTTVNTKLSRELTDDDYEDL